MATLSENEISVKIYTRREGLASPFAHDLEIRAQRLTCEFRKSGHGAFAVEAHIDARRLRVRCAVTGMHEESGVLSLADKDRINAHIQQDVLHTDTFPDIHFVSTHVDAVPDSLDVTGELTLMGCTRTIRLLAHRVHRHFVATTQIHQPDFGIKPFAAPLGLMRVKPDVLVEISLPEEIGLLI